MNGPFVIGIDAGTGSVRAALFDRSGRMAGYGARDITLWRPTEHYVEQSSDEIWGAACGATRDALAAAQVSPDDVAGISFDATCSLVALDRNDRPLTVSPTGNAAQNVIVWMDHRAIAEAEHITASRHRLLRYVGGRISPEMEPPKLLWLRKHIPSTWKEAGKFLDLADFLTYRATGVDARSLCTTTCKWAYDGPRGMWDESFYASFGMGALIRDNKIGSRIVPMGTLLGTLTQEAADGLGLRMGTKVAAGIIDAHAGGIGVMGMGFRSAPTPAQLEGVLALIGGTSSCHMAVSRMPKFIGGIWGPYKSAMIPGLWLTEGGQSATGSLLDHMISNNGRYGEIRTEAERQGQSIYDYLNGIVQELKKRQRTGGTITGDLHILPYFLGNRSPHADPSARGMISGLTLDDSIETVARIYYATIQAIAYGTRHIIEEMNAHGYRIRRIHACGGGTKNPLWLQEHADITGCTIVLPREPEAVLLGTAMLAAVGAGLYPSITDAAARMSGVGARFLHDRSTSRIHEQRYRVFRRMYADQRRYRRMLTQ
ncbi:MAG: FGGY-family carbohydrate kinase [Bacteroidota bacterium]